MEVTETQYPVTSYESLPTESPLYVACIRYAGNSMWYMGPSGPDKQQVIADINNYTGVEACRIYTLLLPVKSLPTA